jgi:hypothetical protein
MKLRIACLGDYTTYFSWYLHGIMEGSILNGAWFRPINIRQSLESIEEQIDYFKPHLMFTHMILGQEIKCGHIVYHRESLHKLLRKVKKRWGIKIAHQEGDPRGELRYEADVSDIIDLGLLNHSMIDKFSIWGIKCVHWPYFSMVQENLNDKNSLVECEVAFAGNLSQRSPEHQHHGRYEFVNALSERLKVKTFPNDTIGNTRFFTPEIASSAKAVLGIHQGFNLHGYLDTRPFQYIGAGALYFHDYNPAINQFFEEGKHFIGYNRFDVNDFVEKFNYYTKENPEAGEKIRRQGFDYCQKYQTSKHRVGYAIDLLQGKDIRPLMLLKDIRKIDEDC